MELDTPEPHGQVGTVYPNITTVSTDRASPTIYEVSGLAEAGGRGNSVEMV